MAILPLSQRSVGTLPRIPFIFGTNGINRALKAQPNAAHYALAMLSVPEIRHKIAPGSTFTLITQNVDNLSPRANERVFSAYGATPPTDPPCLIEMHGRLFDVLCSRRNCKHAESNTSSPVCEALAGTEDLVEHQQMDPEIHEEGLPRCGKCDGLARPGVVWFGEKPHHMPVINSLIEQADLCLVVGTSSTVRSVTTSTKSLILTIR